MREIQKVLAWGYAVLLIISGATALFLFNIEQRAFSAESYKQAFEKQGLYVRMPSILAEALHDSIIRDENSTPYLEALTVSDWEVSIANLLPPDELKAISDAALDSVFAYLNNETDSASISLVLLKRQISGPQGVELVTEILNAQPDCSLEQLMQMGLGFLSGELTLCNPPEEMMGLVTPVIETQLQLMTSSIPDEIKLISSEKNNPADDPRTHLTTLRTFMKWTAVFPLIFLFGVTMFAVRSLQDWLKWWGYSFLITGAISLFFALVGSPILGLAVQAAIQRQEAGFLPPVLVPVLGETVSSVARQTLLPVIIQGAVIGAIGLGMVVAELFTRER